MNFKCSKESHSASPAVYLCSENSCWRLLCLKCVPNHEKEFHNGETKQNLELIEECFEMRASHVQEVNKKLEGEWKAELELNYSEEQEKKIDETYREISELIRKKFEIHKNEFMEKRYQTNDRAKFFARTKEICSDLNNLIKKEAKTDAESLLLAFKKIDSRLEEINLLRKNLDINEKNTADSLLIQINPAALENIKKEIDNLFKLKLAEDPLISKSSEIFDSMQKLIPEEELAFNIFYEDMQYQFGISSSDSFFKYYHHSLLFPSNIGFILTIACRRVFGPYFIEIASIKRQTIQAGQSLERIDLLSCSGAKTEALLRTPNPELYVLKLKIINNSNVVEYFAAFLLNEFKFVLNPNQLSLGSIKNDANLTKSVLESVSKYLTNIKADVLQRKIELCDHTAELSLDSSFIKIEDSKLAGSALIFQNSPAYFFPLDSTSSKLSTLQRIGSLQDFVLYGCYNNAKVFINQGNQMAFMSFENPDWLFFHFEAGQSRMLQRSLVHQDGTLNISVLESTMKNYFLDGSFEEITSVEPVQARGNYLLLSRTGELFEFTTPEGGAFEAFLFSVVLKDSKASFEILLELSNMYPVVKTHDTYLFSTKTNEWRSFAADDGLVERWRWNSFLLQRDSAFFLSRFKLLSPDSFAYVKNNLESVVLFKEGNLINLLKSDGDAASEIRNCDVKLSLTIANTEISFSSDFATAYIRWVDHRTTKHEIPACLNEKAFRSSQAPCQNDGSKGQEIENIDANNLLSSVQLFLKQGQEPMMIPKLAQPDVNLMARKNSQEQREERPRKKIQCLNRSETEKESPSEKKKIEERLETVDNEPLRDHTVAAQTQAPQTLHEDEVTCFDLYEPKNLVFSGSFDKSLTLFDYEKGTILFTIKDYHKSFIWAMKISGGFLITVANDQTVKLSEIDSLLNSKETSQEAKIGFICYCIEVVEFDTKLSIFLGGAAGMLGTSRVSSIEDKITLSEKLQAHEDNVTALKFLHKARALISVSYDKSIRVWAFGEDLRTPPIDCAYDAHSGFINCLEITNEDHIITSSSDMSIKIWLFNTDSSKLEAMKSFKSVGEVVWLEPFETRVFAVSDLQIALLDKEAGLEPVEALKDSFDVKALKFANNKKLIILVSKFCSINTFYIHKILPLYNQEKI